MGLHEHLYQRQVWSGKREPGLKEGVEFERAFLGEALLQADEHPDRLSVDFDDAIKFAKEHQPGLTGRPQLAKELRLKIMNLTNPDEVVRFYTAVGTPLDIHHGIDGFFEQGDRRVTIDVSLRDKEKYKADVLIVGSIDEQGNVVVTDEELSFAAAQIAERLRGTPVH